MEPRQVTQSVMVPRQVTHTVMESPQQVPIPAHHPFPQNPHHSFLADHFLAQTCSVVCANIPFIARAVQL